jgi:hypothetical protein
MNAILHDALQFTDADLALNRAGKLSSAQTRRINKYLDTELLSVAIGFIILWVSIIGIRYFYMPDFIASNPYVEITIEDVQTYLLAFGGVVSVIMVLYTAWRQTRLRQLASEGGVQMRAGVAKTWVETSDSYIWHHLRVDGLDLRIAPQAYAAFQNGAPYRVYYLPATRTLLSAEAL